jgi:nucleoid DNA-binding protein
MSELIGHTMTSSLEPNETVRLVDFGFDVVRIYTARYPVNVWTTLTFMRPANENEPAQSYKITFNAKELKAFVDALSDEQQLTGDRT